MMDSISLEWANEQKTVLLVTYNDETWTWDEVLESLHQQYSMVERVNDIVDTVIDMRKARLWPKTGSSFKVFHKAGELRHPRQGYTIVVGISGVVEMMSNLMLRLYEERRQLIYFVSTIEEIWTVLERITNDRRKN